MKVKMIGNDTDTNRIRTLVEKTNKENPTQKDLEALRAVFKEQPWFARQVGNLRQSVFDTILKSYVGESAMGKEAVEFYIEEMKKDMNYENSSFVERLLIDEIVMRWLRLQMVEQAHYNATGKSHSFKEGIYFEKRLHLTQKRYLGAVEALAKVRKMVVQTQAKGLQMFKDLVEIKEIQERESEI